MQAPTKTKGHLKVERQATELHPARVAKKHAALLALWPRIASSPSTPEIDAKQAETLWRADRDNNPRTVTSEQYYAKCDLQSALGDLRRSTSELARQEEAFAKRVATHTEYAPTGERMTCQCCSRDIHAATGTIAHHGYTRPGFGMQTSSCLGAKHLPFEKDHARLDWYITHLEQGLATMIAARANVAAEQRPLFMRYYRRDRTTASFEVTRATFAQIKEEHAAYFEYRMRTTFDDMLRTELSNRDSQIADRKRYIADRKKFRSTFKHTHNYNAATKSWKEVTS